MNATVVTYEVPPEEGKGGTPKACKSRHNAPRRSPDVPLNGHSREVRAPPFSLTVGPGEQTVPRLSKLFCRVLRNLLPVNLVDVETWVGAEMRARKVCWGKLIDTSVQGEEKECASDSQK